MVKTFTMGDFFLVEWDFLMGERVTKCQQNYTLKRTTLHHLKKSFSGVHVSRTFDRLGNFIKYIL